METVTRPGCPCSSLSLCPECFAELTKRDADVALREWLQTWDAAPMQAPERREPRLRLVRPAAALAVLALPSLR